MQSRQNAIELFFRFYGLDIAEVDKCLEKQDDSVSRAETKTLKKFSRI